MLSEYGKKYRDCKKQQVHSHTYPRIEVVYYIGTKTKPLKIKICLYTEEYFYYLIFYLKVIFTHLLHPQNTNISRDANKNTYTTFFVQQQWKKASYFFSIVCEIETLFFQMSRYQTSLKNMDATISKIFIRHISLVVWPSICILLN